MFSRFQEKAMDLIINQYGTRIKSSGERIKLVFPHQKKAPEYVARRLNKISILSPCSISSGAVQCALKHKVDIVYLSYFGKPIGRITPTCPYGQASLRRAQAQFVADPKKNLAIAKKIIFSKSHNQIQYLEFLQKKYQKDFSIQLKTIKKTRQKIKKVDRSEKLFGLEGQIAAQYFETIKTLINFKKRNPQGKDLFNAALNYGYGILYNEIESACLQTGFDPCLGFYHTDRSNKPSLVCDLIEEFRTPIVEFVIFPLLIEKKLLKEKHISSTGLITKIGRKKIITRLQQRLYTEIIFNNKRVVYLKAIEKQTLQLAQVFLGKKREFSGLDKKIKSLAFN
jgi:CRISPR-associated protein Cas1